MLYLQRASAGSGKTFTLAKTFIRSFLAEKDERGNYRLKKTIGDSHGRILAITFTNKATNEMKQRIVDKLADLAGVTGKPDEKTDYLKDFAEEFGVSKKDIRRQAMSALKTLLHTYSEFQVSTIDSFFQLVLRSFANDTDLNDNYRIELNDSYIAQIGVDATLSEVKTTGSDKAKRIRNWIGKIVDEKLLTGDTWNPFNKSGGSNNTGIYGELIAFTQLIYKESFKEIQKELTDYFEQGTDILELTRQMKQYGELQVSDSRRIAVVNAQKIIGDLTRNGFDLDCCFIGFATFIKGVLKAEKKLTPPIMEITGNVKKFYDGDKDLFTKKSDKENKLTEKFPDLAETARDMIANVEKWRDAGLLYETNISKLHYLGILQEIMLSIKEFRDENNVIPISETNQLLRRIINDDDAPFIYERIGSYINHYLIDEFQDTSQLQWDNLRPLLLESTANNNDNLIIGDVKQSIYRFRNAEPDLIDREVPTDKVLNVMLRGNSPEENKNWRSACEIVEFNNKFFSDLSKYIDKTLPLMNRTLEDMYVGVCQEIRYKDLPGYVKVRLEKDKAYKNMGDLVAEILSRGYQQKDIAFLVNRKSDGMELISEIMEYNKDKDEQSKINIISEESLLISESRAVKIIISILQSIADGMAEAESKSTALENTGGQELHRKIDLTVFVRNYNYFISKNPDLTALDAIEAFLSGEFEDLKIDEMLAEMQTVALPALIETIAKKFVEPEILNDNASYVAALQDVVLDYCESYPSDVASFLKWWNSNKNSCSISSPEGTNAVNIMTIHKSKGLEFDCVILPDADWNFEPEGNHVETLWVNPVMPDEFKSNPNYLQLPPVVPIDTNKKLEFTPYREAYAEYLDKVKVDQLNKTYVAFTRAKRELYVYSTIGFDKPKSGQQSKPSLSNRLGYCLYEMLHTAENNEKTQTDAGDDCFLFTYGKPTQPKVDVFENKEENKPLLIKSYNVNLSPDMLVFKTDSDDSIFDEEDDPDPRSVGNILHLIMSKINHPEDLHRAVLTVKARGLINDDQAAVYENKLARTLASEEMKEWFADDVRIITERPILSKAVRINYRPDRVVVMPDNTVIVIDYKFGQKNVQRYAGQVTNYMELLHSIDEFKKAEIKGCLCFLGRSEHPDVVFL